MPPKKDVFSHIKEFVLNLEANGESLNFYLENTLTFRKAHKSYDGFVHSSL